MEVLWPVNPHSVWEFEAVEDEEVRQIVVVLS